MARGSIGLGASRWLTRSSVTTCAASREGGLGRCGVAVPRFRRDVARRGRPHQRRTGSRGVGGVHDARQRLVADVDGFHGVARLRDRLRDHRGHCLADEADGADRERVPRRGRGRRAVGAPEVGRQRQRLDARADEVVAGHDGDHAGQRCRRRRVDGGDARVRMRRAQEADVGLARAASRRRRKARRPSAGLSSSTRRTDLPLPKRADCDSVDTGDLVGGLQSVAWILQRCAAVRIVPTKAGQVAARVCSARIAA